MQHHFKEQPEYILWLSLGILISVWEFKPKSQARKLPKGKESKL
jgi:hypothetical protein